VTKSLVVSNDVREAQPSQQCHKIIVKMLTIPRLLHTSYQQSSNAAAAAATTQLQPGSWPHAALTRYGTPLLSKRIGEF